MVQYKDNVEAVDALREKYKLYTPKFQKRFMDKIK
jgi:hypothetical protein